MRAVNKPVRLVLFRGFPCQMFRITASEMSLAAKVRGMMLRCWRGAIFVFADDAGHKMAFAVTPDPTITIITPRKGPNQAIVAVEGEYGAFEKGERLTVRHPPAKRITMSPPALIMCTAPIIG